MTKFTFSKHVSEFAIKRAQKLNYQPLYVGLGQQAAWVRLDTNGAIEDAVPLDHFEKNGNGEQA